MEGAAARRAWDLAPRLPTVVAMAGTQGSLGRLHDVVLALLTVERPLQAVVVAGRDERLRAGSPAWPRAARCGWWATWRTCARCWPRRICS